MSPRAGRPWPKEGGVVERHITGEFSQGIAPGMREASHVGSLSGPRAGAWRRAGRSLRASDWWYFSVLPLVSLAGDIRCDDDVVVRLVGAVVVAALCHA